MATALDRNKESLDEHENRQTHTNYLSLTDMYSGCEEGGHANSSANESSSALTETSLATAELAALRIDFDDSLYGQLDRYGFIVLADSQSNRRSVRTHEREELEERKRQEKEATRAVKWVDMLPALEREKRASLWPQAHRKFLSRLAKGIPDCIRMKAWALMLQEQDVCLDYYHLYRQLSGFERQIDLDIERTLRDHVLFRQRFGQAQVSLFKILVAYSNHDPTVGYCQGMSTVAAFLLLYFEEETAFRCLVRLLEWQELTRLYMTGFPLLFEYFYVQEQLLAKYMPALSKHLVKGLILALLRNWHLRLRHKVVLDLIPRIPLQSGNTSLGSLSLLRSGPTSHHLAWLVKVFRGQVAPPGV